MINKRYERNLVALTEDEQQKLFDSNVCVIGCGGLGGYVIEILSRLGVGHITAVDGDVFDESNLNRQILSEVDLIGEKKALAAKNRVARVNPDVELTPIAEFITAENGEDILKGHDLVIDALDNPSDRLLIKDICNRLGITMVHGAIGGWYGQLSVVRPGDDILDKLYGSIDGEAPPFMGNPSFIPPVVASMEVAESVKVLLKKETPLYGKLLTIDLLENEFEIIEF
jgi:molybdopterin/thiamine biosynthesis adenylyltransferase